MHKYALQCVVRFACSPSPDDGYIMDKSWTNHLPAGQMRTWHEANARGAGGLAGASTVSSGHAPEGAGLSLSSNVPGQCKQHLSTSYS